MATCRHSLVKRILRKHGYPADKQAKATRTVLEQAEVLSGGWVEMLLSEYKPEPRIELRVVEPLPEEKYRTCVPLIQLKAAAGAFGDAQYVADEEFEWVQIATRQRLRPGMLVARVGGKSMETLIPHNSHCLFASPVTGTRQGRILLVQPRDEIDTETGERYTVKQYESEKVETADLWRHSTITLRPLNPEFEPIELTGDLEGRVQAIAEFLEVLGPAE